MTQKTAQQEAWWGDFVAEFGRTPLRELARRFDTNPRRLRRAAQRAGLTEEAAAIRANVELLGLAPDATVASKLSVTVEAVKGARARRGIPPYNKAEPPPKPRKAAPPPRPAPKVRTPEPPAEAEPAVVVKRSPRLRGARSADMPSGASLGRLSRRAVPEPEVTRRSAGRRRIVKKD